MYQEMTFNFIGFVAKAETHSAKNTRYSTLRVARSSRWNDKEGKTQERTDWFTLTSFSEAITELVESGSLTKGRYIIARGEVRENRWTDKDGTDRFDVQFIARTIHFADKKPGGAGDGAAHKAAPDEAPNST